MGTSIPEILHKQTSVKAESEYNNVNFQENTFENVVRKMSAICSVLNVSIS